MFNHDLPVSGWTTLEEGPCSVLDPRHVTVAPKDLNWGRNRPTGVPSFEMSTRWPPPPAAPLQNFTGYTYNL